MKDVACGIFRRCAQKSLKASGPERRSSELFYRTINLLKAEHYQLNIMSLVAILHIHFGRFKFESTLSRVETSVSSLNLGKRWNRRSGRIQMRNASIENLIVLLHMDRLLTKHRQFRTLYSLPSLGNLELYGPVWFPVFMEAWLGLKSG